VIDIENKKLIYSYQKDSFPFQDTFASFFEINPHQLEHLHDHLP